MLKAILHRLEGDTALSAHLGVTEDDPRIYPLSVGDFGPAISYSDSPLEAGAVNLSRLELRVTAPTLDQCVTICDRLEGLVNIAEDEPGFQHEEVTILSASVNGGGTLEFESFVQRFMFFDIKWCR